MNKTDMAALYGLGAGCLSVGAGAFMSSIAVGFMVFGALMLCASLMVYLTPK